MYKDNFIETEPVICRMVVKCRYLNKGKFGLLEFILLLGQTFNRLQLQKFIEQ